MGAAAMTDMTMTDATILASLLTELRLPSIARNWKRITEAANREGWPAQKTLATLLEIEVAERASRRIQRHRDQSETPVGKTFASFDFTAAPELSKPHLLALGAGGDWIKNGDNLLVFGESGTGKSHALAAICHALPENGSCSLRPSIWSNGCKSRAATSPWSAPSRSSTNTISSCSTTSRMFVRTKPRPASCSNSLRIDTNDTASLSPPTSRFRPGTLSFPMPP